VEADEMPKIRSTNPEQGEQLTFDEFARRHGDDLSNALTLIGLSMPSFSGMVPLARMATPDPLPPLPPVMQELKRTSLFRLLTAAGRENCPDAYTCLMFIWMLRMGIKIPEGAFVKPRGKSGRPRNAFRYYATWISIGSPQLQLTKLASTMFGELFKRANKADRKKMVDRCRKAVIRFQNQLDQNPSE
jgi:hypothetical protein